MTFRGQNLPVPHLCCQLLGVVLENFGEYSRYVRMGVPLASFTASNNANHWLKCDVYEAKVTEPLVYHSPLFIIFFCRFLLNLH